MARPSSLLRGLNFRILAVLVVALTVSPNALAAPQRGTQSQSNSCTPSCRRSHDSKLNYEEGKSYIYDFTSESVTQIVGSSSESSKVQVRGQAVLSAQSSCDIILTVRQAAIQGPSGQAVRGIEALESSSVRFAIQDGAIEGLCVSENDPTWSANIKRALVSMFQNKALKNSGESLVSETDVSGRCPTQYKVVGDKYVKTRDLNSCTQREGGNTLFLGVPYNVASKYNSMPGLDSNSTCTQEMSQGIFKSISCTETHFLEPFSQGEAGAQTKIVSSMKFSSTQNGLSGVKSSGASKPSSILYDHADYQEIQGQQQGSSYTQTLLTKICSEMQAGTISAKVPGLFLQLQKSMKTVSSSELKSLQKQISSGSFCQQAKKLNKLLLDAAAISATDAAISLLADVQASGQLDEQTESSFHLYMTFASNPGPKAIRAVSKLVGRDQPSDNLILAASGLAHQYCKMRNPECEQNNDYAQLVNQIAEIASANCVAGPGSQAKSRRAVAALQALGNLDKLTAQAVSEINKCLEVPQERIQILALDAFRRDPCQHKLTQKAREIMGNHGKSSDVRIQAYLAISKCMQSEDIEAIQQIFTKGKSNQVMSFVASHVRNQLEASAPGEQQQQLKSAMQQIRIPNDVPQDILKYSRNIEWSTFSQDSNMGASLEGNMIFSQHSYLPRMITTNATAHMFGRSYNLVDAGIYLKNFEHAMEKQFGPLGSLKDSAVGNWINRGKEKLQNIGNFIRNRVRRAARKQSQEIDDEQVDYLHNEVEIENRYDANGVGDMYLRIMGTAVLAESFNMKDFGSNSISSSINEGFSKMFRGAKDHKTDLTQPIMFLNDEITIPTTSGLPINLQVKGTTILSLQMSGNLDLEQLFQSNADSNNVHMKFAPSTATTLKARMSVGTGPIEAGLQVEGTVQSSSAVEIAVTRGNNEFDLKINIPQEKNHVLEVRSDLFWVEQIQEQLETKSVMNTKTSQKNYARPNDCLTSNILGLKLCSAVTIPDSSPSAPRFPLNGPCQVSLSIEKTEKSMQGYHAHVVTQLDDPSEKTLSVMMDTPGSQSNRKIEAIAKYVKNPTTLTLQVDSPWKKFNALYALETSPSLNAVKVEFTSENEMYGAKAQIKRSGSIYEPLLQYSTPNGEQNLLEGSVNAVSGQKLAIDIRTDAPTIKALQGEVKADIQKTGQNKYQINTLELNYPSWGVGKLGLSGNVKIADTTSAMNLVAQYGEASHTLNVNSTFTRIPKQRIALETHVKSTRNPAANVDLTWAASVDPQTDAMEHKLVLVQGVGENKLTVKQRSLYDAESRKNFEILNELEVTRPSNNVDFKLRVDAKKTDGQSQQYELLLSSGKSHRAEVKLLTGADAFFDYKCSAALQYPGQLYELSETASKTASDTWKYVTTLNAQPGSRYDAVTMLVLKNGRTDVENSISTNITSAALAQPIRFKSGFVRKSSSSQAQLYLETDGESKVDIQTAYKYSGGKPHAVDVKANIKNYMNLVLSETHSKSSSNLKFDMKWIPSDRQIVADSQYKNQGEQFNFDGQIKWDAQRDKSKSATIKSVTTLGSGWSIETNNDITFKGKSANMNLKGKIAKNVLDGEHFVDMNLRTPSNKNYGLFVKNLIETTPRIKSSKINAKVQLPDAQPYQIDWENRLANIDMDKMTFEILSDLKATYDGQHNIQLHGEINSLLTNKRVLTGHYAMSGSALSAPISLDHNFELRANGFKVATNGKYGSKASSFEVGVKHDLYSPKRTADVNFKVTLPMNPKSIEGSTKYLWEFNSWRNFQISEVGTVTLNNGVPTTWSNILRANENEFQAQSEVIDAGNQAFNLGLQGRKDKKRFVLDLTGLVSGHGAKFFTNIEGQFPYYNVRANGTLTPRSTKGYDFKLYHRSAQAGQSIDTELTMQGRGSRFVLTNKFENYPKRKAIDLLVSDGSTPRKVYILLTENTPKWNLDSLIKWGESGKVLSTKGGLEFNNDFLDASISMDSPALKVDKWAARVSRKVSSGRHSIAVNVEGKSEQIVSLGLEYAKKNERNGETYDGKIKIDSKKSRFNGDFRVENNQLDRKRDGEDGKQVKATLQLSGQSLPMKVVLLSKTTDLEKRFSASFCKEADKDCQIGDVIFRHEYHDDNDVDYSLKATSQKVSSGKKSTDGILITASRANGGSRFEHIAQLIINEEKEGQIGYRVYRKVGSELGLEVQLPERLISTVAKAEKKEGSKKAEVSLWMDKKRKPEEKLSMAVSVDSISASGNSSGTKTLIVLQHPALPQELKFRSKLIQGGENTILDLVAEADIFKHNGQMVWTTKIVRQPQSNGNTYTADISAVAQSLALNMGVHGEFQQTSNEVTLQTELTYENRQNQTKKSQIELAYTQERVNFSMRSADSQPLLSLSTAWNDREKHGSSGHDIRYEIMLPGMADARIFEAQIHSAIPPHANIKMYTSNATPGNFYEAFVGFQSDKQFSAGLYRQTQEQRHIIEEWSLALKSPRLLMMKADWDAENIETALHDAQERLQQTGNRFKEMLNATWDDSSEEMQQLWTNFAAALPDLEPVSQSYSNQMQEIRQELRTNPETQAVSNYIDTTEQAMQQYLTWASKAAQFISEAVEEAWERASDFAASLPSLISNLGQKLPNFIHSVNESVSSMVDAIVRGATKAMEGIKNVVKDIAHRGGFNWEFLTDVSNGVAKYFQQALDWSVDGLVTVYEAGKSAVAYILENSYLKRMVSQTLNRYQNVLATLIDHVKNQAEALRETVMNAFPQQEAQDFVLAVANYVEKKARGMPVDDAAAHKDIYKKFVAAVRKASSELYTVDLQNGLVVAQIPLPKPINSLSDFDQLFLIDMPNWKINFKQSSYGYGLTEAYNFVKADSLTNFIHRILFTSETTVPPMPAYALLVGSQYFRTFDGKFYHFEGNCQYLMASDFVDKNFTIAIDYEGEGPSIQKSILINYHGELVTIKPDFTTEVQRRSGSEERQLLKIEDDASDVTLQDRSGALTITCAKKQDVCLFTLSGYYHGKTMGLLGTNNNEHYDDFSSPKGRVMENPEEFAASWKLDQQCQETPIQPHSVNASREAREACSNVFQGKTSMMRSCFGAVNPSGFQQVCETLSSEKGYNNRKAVCSASAAYAATCATSLVRVQIPSEC